MQSCCGCSHPWQPAQSDKLLWSAGQVGLIGSFAPSPRRANSPSWKEGGWLWAQAGQEFSSPGQAGALSWKHEDRSCPASRALLLLLCRVGVSGYRQSPEDAELPALLSSICCFSCSCPSASFHPLRLSPAIDYPSCSQPKCFVHSSSRAHGCGPRLVSLMLMSSTWP